MTHGTPLQTAEKHGVAPLLLLNAKAGVANDTAAQQSIRELLDPMGSAGWVAMDLNARTLDVKGLSVDVPTALSGFLQVWGVCRCGDMQGTCAGEEGSGRLVAVCIPAAEVFGSQETDAVLEELQLCVRVYPTVTLHIMCVSHSKPYKCVPHTNPHLRTCAGGCGSQPCAPLSAQPARQRAVT